MINELAQSWGLPRLSVAITIVHTPHFWQDFSEDEKDRAH